MRGILGGAGVTIEEEALGRASVEDAFVSMVREEEHERAKGLAA